MASEPKEMTWSAYIAVLRRRWRETVAAGGLVALVSIYITFALPAMYESDALILIEQQDVSPDFVPTTVTSYLDERIQAIHQRVVAAPNVEALIESLDLYPEDRGTVPIGELIARFQDDAAMEPQHILTVDPRTRRETIVNYAFRLSFLYPDPVKARDVVERLSQLYIEQNRAVRTESAARTTAFLDAEAKQLQDKLADIGERIAQFKELHAGNLPEDQPVNLQMWTRAREDLTRVEAQLREARERLAVLESEIAETPRFRPVMDASGEPVLGGVDRLAAAQQELIRLQGRYSENHPDVIALRREIAALSSGPVNQANLAEQLRAQLDARRQELQAARETYSSNHPDVLNLQSSVRALEEELASLGNVRPNQTQPNNPLYIQLTARIQTAREEISDLTSMREDLLSRINELELLRARAPQVEREFNLLENERQLALVQYQELRNLEGQAAVAQNLETGEGGERLTIIEPARVPTSPASPNRVSLSFLGIILSIAIGLGVASLTEAADTSVRGQHDLQALLEMPPIGIIPYVESRRDAFKRIALNTAMGLAGIGGVALILMTALG